MANKASRCNAALAVFFGIWTVVLLACSYFAIIAVSKSDHWFATDYWLSWFSAATLLAAAISAVVTGLSFASSVDCDVEQ